MQDNSLENSIHDIQNNIHNMLNGVSIALLCLERNELDRCEEMLRAIIDQQDVVLQNWSLLKKHLK